MIFNNFETIAENGRGTHLLRHREKGWHTVVVIDDGQIHPVNRHGGTIGREYASATSAGVDAIGFRMSEAEARRRYELAVNASAALT
jgi:hypothetical protein